VSVGGVSADVGDDDTRTVLQSGANRKKISFRWNSRSLPSGCLVVPSKSAELSVSADSSSRLVPYDDDDDESQTDRDSILSTDHATSDHTRPPVYATSDHTRPPVHATSDHTGPPAHATSDRGVNGFSEQPVHSTDVADEYPARSSEDSRSVSAVCSANGSTDDIVGRNGRDAPLKSAVTADDDTVRLSLSGDNVNGSSDLNKSLSVPCEKTSDLNESLPVPHHNDIASLLTDGAGDAVSSSHQRSSDTRQSVAGRKRHARDRSSRRHHTKHRRRDHTHSCASALYSSDEEREYFWVEKTIETLAHQLTGN